MAKCYDRAVLSGMQFVIKYRWLSAKRIGDTAVLY